MASLAVTLAVLVPLGKTPEASFAEQFFGSDSFIYRANDGFGDSNSATVNLTIDGIDDQPIAANDSYRTGVDEQLVVAASGVLGNDNDVDGEAITAIPWSGSTSNGGSVTLNSNGSFTYTPAASFTGTDTFTYSNTDGNSNSSPATVSVVINDNDPNALYVYDIGFQSGNGGRWRAVVEIRSDSNADGQADSNDEVRAGVTVTVSFGGQLFTGTTDALSYLDFTQTNQFCRARWRLHTHCFRLFGAVSLGLTCWRRN